MTYRTLHSIMRTAAIGSVAALAGCVSMQAAGRNGDPERSLIPRRNCSVLLGEATAALAIADTSAFAVMSAHTRHAAKMAEYHACLAEDP